MVPEIPANAPFSTEQRAWLNGYFASLFGSHQNGAPTAATEAAESGCISVLYGSQTGTAESCAKQLGKAAKSRGYQANVAELDAVSPAELANTSLAMIVCSTHGEGDMPENAEAFWQALNAADAPRLEGLSYAVLGLGDTNYADTFCQAARELDERFDALGASRIAERVDCDVDYDDDFDAWQDNVLGMVGDFVEGATAAEGESEADVPVGATFTPVKVNRPLHDRRNPFPAELLANAELNGDGSDKDVRHIGLALHGSGLNYEVGDALPIRPRNCPEVVEELLAALGSSGSEAVRLEGGAQVPFRKALSECVEIGEVPMPLCQAVTEQLGAGAFTALLNGDTPADGKWSTWAYGRDVCDVLRRFPKATFTPEELLDLLRPLQPRLYSIASSPAMHPGEVHLTVGTVRYHSHGRDRKGVCSTFLADRVDLTTPIPVYVQANAKFRPPEDGRAPMIMVGPGTGIAPFRAFLEERQLQQARGPNWLFFGDQHEASDFLYGEQLQQWHHAGLLTHLHTAFSRDGDEKVYVQHRMWEQREELYDWLRDGAHVYVCGDANRMAKDVDTMLHQVIAEQGKLTESEAAAFVAELKDTGRYQRDVY